MSNDRITALYRDTAGSLWVGTDNGGLNRFETHNNSFTHYKHNPKVPTTLSSNTIVDIAEAEDKTLPD